MAPIAAPVQLYKYRVYPAPVPVHTRVPAPSYTYAGEDNDACGGDGNWGATEMEVWYRVGS